MQCNFLIPLCLVLCKPIVRYPATHLNPCKLIPNTQLCKLLTIVDQPFLTDWSIFFFHALIHLYKSPNYKLSVYISNHLSKWQLIHSINTNLKFTSICLSIVDQFIHLYKSQTNHQQIYRFVHGQSVHPSIGEFRTN